jgi:hypothetical protein
LTNGLFAEQEKPYPPPTPLDEEELDEDFP